MKERRDLFKEIAGQNFEDWKKKNRVPKAKESIDRIFKGNRSKYGLRFLGYGTEEDLWIAEEERTHTHIISGTRQGKSKFLEKNIQYDIDRLINRDEGACGLTLLDPTDSGETAYNVLKYCLKRGFKRVCIIDPYHYSQFGRVVSINPFKYAINNKWADINSVNNTLQVTSDIKDAAQTKRIQRYLRALLSVLWDAGATLADTEYFTDFPNPIYEAKRREILQRVNEFDRHRILIEWVFKNLINYRDFESTVRRIEDLLDEPLRSMFSHREGIDFEDMIRDKWVVLVNLDADGPLELIHTRLLGTAVINEILSALHRMRKTRNWSKPYYLYIDEAADYANRKLARVLSHKGKTGIRVYLAHQSFGHFEDKYVLNQVMTNCDTKVMLNLPGPDDRTAMVKALGYGGDITDREASFANADLPKQTMVYKEPKGKPKRYLVVDCITPKIPYAKEKQFIQKLLEYKWCYPVTERTYDAPRASNPSPKKRPVGNQGSARKASAPGGRDGNKKRERVFDSLREDEITYSTNAGEQPLPRQDGTD